MLRTIGVLGVLIGCCACSQQKDSAHKTTSETKLAWKVESQLPLSHASKPSESTSKPISTRKVERRTEQVKPLVISLKAVIYEAELDAKTVKLLNSLTKCKSSKKRERCERRIVRILDTSAYEKNDAVLNTLLKFVLNRNNDIKHREMVSNAIRLGQFAITKKSAPTVLNVKTADALFYGALPRKGEFTIARNLGAPAVRVNMLLGRHDMVKSYIRSLEDAIENEATRSSALELAINFAHEPLLYIGGMRYWPLLKKRTDADYFSVVGPFDAIARAMYRKYSAVSERDKGVICKWAETTLFNGERAAQISRTMLLTRCPDEHTRLAPIIGKAIIKHFGEGYTDLELLQATKMLCSRPFTLPNKKPIPSKHCDDIRRLIVAVLNDSSHSSYQRTQLMERAFPIFYNDPKGFLAPYLKDPALEEGARRLMKTIKK